MCYSQRTASWAVSRLPGRWWQVWIEEWNSSEVLESHGMNREACVGGWASGCNVGSICKKVITKIPLCTEYRRLWN